INSIIQVEEDLKRIAEKFRNADDQDVTMEEGAMCGKLSTEEKDKFDGVKFAKDTVGELSGVYDIERAVDGIDPSTGEELSTTQRFIAAGTFILGLTPVGKIGKAAKVAKMADKAHDVSKEVKMAEDAKLLQSGGRDYLTQYDDGVHHVEKMYDEIRASSNDVAAITKNTGWKEERINRIKEHVFMKEHTLSRGIDRFDPDYGIARAWQRLEKGIHHENDIKLLKHEYFESRFEGIFKTDYVTAHRKTVDSGRPWDPPETEPMIPFDEHLKVPLDKVFD
ncbi:pre-toxin TG domain-containing protein, partial [Bacillus cereus]|uniref:pre-toxin TG domain-containing protein n=2 Tax=Bacillaceae TaxID=186817 RepID=UPI000B28A942